jgi:hypothetical protein
MHLALMVVTRVVANVTAEVASHLPRNCACLTIQNRRSMHCTTLDEDHDQGIREKMIPRIGLQAWTLAPISLELNGGKDTKTCLYLG